MSDGLNILLAGEYTDDLTRLEALLNPVQELECRSAVVSPSSVKQVLARADQQEEATDVVILWLDEQPELLLEPLRQFSHQNLTILVIGPQDNMPLVRAAMHAGVYDYLGHKSFEADLMKCLQTIFHEKQQRPNGRLTAVMPMSGGVGGSFVACNLACAMAKSEAKTLLLDMDLMRGSILQMLDLKANYGLDDVLAQLDGMDYAALEGLLTQHDSGLNVLAAREMNLLSGQKPDTVQVTQLISLLRGYAQEVVVDLPMTPVSISSAVLQQAETVCLVVQQEMVVLRNAIHWIDLCEKEWGISRDRFLIIVNSYSKGLDISIEDIKKILGVDNIIEVPHDHIKVTHSINAGLPIAQHAPHASVTRAIIDIHTHFNPEAAEETSGIRKLAAKLFRRA